MRHTVPEFQIGGTSAVTTAPCGRAVMARRIEQGQNPSRFNEIARKRLRTARGPREPHTQTRRSGRPDTMTRRIGHGRTAESASAEKTVLKKVQGPRGETFNAYNRPHADLREFIARAESAGEIVRIMDADWKLEMGTLAEIVNHGRPEPPAILFEEVPGYGKEMRLLSGATNSSKRLAIALGLPVPDHPLDVVRAYRERMKTHRPIPPKTVAKGPVLENVDRDGAVDLLKFPVPFLHEHDGGRYIGTDDLVIMRDPDADWVNCGTYRAMVQDRNHVSL